MMSPVSLRFFISVKFCSVNFSAKWNESMHPDSRLNKNNIEPLVKKLSGDETSESESSSRLSTHLGSEDSLWAATLVTMPVERGLGNSFFSHSRSDVLPMKDILRFQRVVQKMFHTKKKNVFYIESWGKNSWKRRRGLRFGAIIWKQLKCRSVLEALLYASVGPLRSASLASRFGQPISGMKVPHICTIVLQNIELEKNI